MSRKTYIVQIRTVTTYAVTVSGHTEEARLATIRRRVDDAGHTMAGFTLRHCASRTVQGIRPEAKPASAK